VSVEFVRRQLCGFTFGTHLARRKKFRAARRAHRAFKPKALIFQTPIASQIHSNLKNPKCAKYAKQAKCAKYANHLFIRHWSSVYLARLADLASLANLTRCE
jgi:hypothetical protein